MTWKVIDSRAIGNSHLREEKPCQDYVGFWDSPNEHLVIGAVADGSGSAKHSDKGAEIAVNCTIQYLQQRLNFSKFQFQIKNQFTANNFFRNLLKTVQKELEKQANNKSYSVKDFACTLLVFIATPDWLAAMQVGDGLIVIRQNSCNDYKLLFKPYKGEYVNQTTFVTSSNAQNQMKVFFDKRQINFICAATDWCENIAVTQLENWQPLTNFFKPLEDCVLTNGKEIGKSEIDNLLNSNLVNEETDDDKTLLLCVWDDSRLIVEPKITEENQGFVDEPNISPIKNFDKSRKARKLYRNHKRINKALLISAVINLVALFVILFLTYKVNQPVATSYFINNIDGTPTPITLEKKPLSIDVWVLTSLQSLDKESKTITVANEKLHPIYLVDVPSPKRLDQTPLGYLPAGTYRYYKAKNFDQFYPESPHRWVRLKMEH